MNGQMSTVDDLTLGRVRLSTRAPDGTTVDYGKVDVAVRAGEVRAVRRRTTIAAAPVVSSVQTSRVEWEFTLDDGAVWYTQGCGCTG